MPVICRCLIHIVSVFYYFANYTPANECMYIPLRFNVSRPKGDAIPSHRFMFQAFKFLIEQVNGTRSDVQNLPTYLLKGSRYKLSTDQHYTKYENILRHRILRCIQGMENPSLYLILLVSNSSFSSC
jgi:hypothetical protein